MKKLTLAACLALAGSLPLAASAQSYPERPVRVIQGYAAGGNADTIARTVSAEMSKTLGQTFVVEAQTGAGGTIAAGTVARSKPDGYTLLLTTGGHAVAGALYKTLSFDPVKDFEMISTVTYFPFLLVAPANSPYKNLSELLKAAKASPGKITFGTAGVGTTHHLGGELLNSSAGVQMMHVPYRGDAASVVALMGNEIDFIIAPPTAVISNIQAGTLRALASTGPQRWPGLPDVPTAAEQGVTGYDVQSWAGFMAPADTPKDVVSALNKAIQSALQVPDVQARLKSMGGAATGSTPEEMTTLVSSEIEKWTQVAKGAGIDKQ